jgi:hypothetical protein
LTQSRAELATFVKARGNHPSSDQKLEIMKHREKLAKQLEDFSEAGQGNFPNLDLREGTIHDPPLSEEILDDNDWSDCEDEMAVPTVPSLPNQDYGSAEHQQILLPSSFRAALLPPSLGEGALYSPPPIPTGFPDSYRTGLGLQQISYWLITIQICTGVLLESW